MDTKPFTVTGRLFGELLHNVGPFRYANRGAAQRKARELTDASHSFLRGHEQCEGAQVEHNGKVIYRAVHGHNARKHSTPAA